LLKALQIPGVKEVIGVFKVTYMLSFIPAAVRHLQA